MEIFILLYSVAILLIAEIDRKYIKIDKNILACGIVSSIIYMIYLYIIDFINIYLIFAYLGIHLILLVIDTVLLKKYAQDSYIVKILMLLNVIFIFTEAEITIYSILLAIIAILIYVLILRSKQRKNGNKKIKFSQIPLGFFLGASNVMVLIMMVFITNYWIK